MKLLGTIMAFVILVGLAKAQNATQCDGTTYEMRMCLSKIHQKSDAELNAAYRAALQEMRDSKRHSDSLRTAERRWIAYRDAQCKAQYDLFEGGTGGPIEELACLIEMTDQRTAELKRIYLSPR